MNYNNVIPFDGRGQSSIHDSGCGSAVPPSTPMSCPLEVQSATTRLEETPAGVALLFEQLEYLIQFADQERDRFDRVKAILLETFN